MLLLFQGDSITDCGRDREQSGNALLGNGYVSLLAGALSAQSRHQLINRGVSGNRITDLHARWEDDALELNPDAVSILIGVNDTWHGKTRGHGVPVDEYGRVYHQLLAVTRRKLPDVQLVLCEPFVLPCGVVTPDWRPEIDERRAVVRQLARDFGACFVPFQTAFDETLASYPAEYLAADGVHPTAAGHQLMADCWLSTAGEVLAKGGAGSKHPNK